MPSNLFILNEPWGDNDNDYNIRIVTGYCYHYYGRNLEKNAERGIPPFMDRQEVMGTIRGERIRWV